MVASGKMVAVAISTSPNPATRGRTSATPILVGGHEIGDVVNSDWQYVRAAVAYLPVSCSRRLVEAEAAECAAAALAPSRAAATAFLGSVPPVARRDRPFCVLRCKKACSVV